MTAPKVKHRLIQRNLRRLLEDVADQGSYVDSEVGFRPLPEYEYWEADVAYISADRYRLADPESNIQGAPDLVIEVLSPSNTAAEIMDREQTCLTNGSREFWVVDPKRQRIRVTTSDGRISMYEAGQEIPVLFTHNTKIRVDDVFKY